MVRRAFVVVALAVAAAVAVPAAGSSRLGAPGLPSPAQDALVRLNQIQVVGSHNSYKAESSQAEKDVRRAAIGAAEDALEYSHVPLDQQFANQRIRQIELDVWRDDAGGKYANPLIRQVTGGGPYDPAMLRPGIKVFHTQDVDYRTTCLSLIACLSVVKSWTDANPTAAPIAILLELKDAPLSAGGITFTTPDPWTNTAALDRLDGEIRSVFTPEDLITPDDVRGAAPTLDQAVRTTGWPTLAQSRGKVLFLMDNEGAYRTSYIAGHPSLQGRAIFTNANPGDPDAAFVKRNDAKGSFTDIQNLVRQGYVVRTRADADTIEARTNDTSTRDAALASGAQWVSTDYPVEGPTYAQRWGTDYVVQLPGGVVARCNPINAPPVCESASLDTIYTPAPPPTFPPTTPTTTPPPPPPPPPTAPTTTVPEAPPAEPVGGAADFTG
ncbi:MAG: phosphatidylinositol-specific phospholipase C1-like protein [Actinobacteria bacterium]|nr:phosphatidylinositol-specific phospholipase C1-like protein [Actinomycetota bacterium]